MTDTIAMRVSRYRPEQETAPTVQEYEVPLRPDWAVLDGLNHIKDHQDGTLSYRWSCRMGICGSCGMTVDGEPMLTCATFLTDYAPGPVRVEPLSNFPVIRDLVVEIGDFLRKLPKVLPWIVRGSEKPTSEGEYLQTPAEQDAYKQYSMCINCMLCYSACPVYGLDPHFIGPAAIALAQRYNLDSRDQGAADRLELLTHPDGVSSASAPVRVPRASTPPAPSSSTSSPQPCSRSRLSYCRGVRGECAADLYRVPPSVVPQAHGHAVVAAPPLVPSLRAARIELCVHRVVRDLPASADPRRRHGEA
jgi:fumarate reductase iron-sulfur subunit